MKGSIFAYLIPFTDHVSLILGINIRTYTWMIWGQGCRDFTIFPMAVASCNVSSIWSRPLHSLVVDTWVMGDPSCELLRIGQDSWTVAIMGCVTWKVRLTFSYGEIGERQGPRKSGFRINTLASSTDDLHFLTHLNLWSANGGGRDLHFIVQESTSISIVDG